MPAMIPTPWIRAYDPAQEFLAGHGQGVQIAEANARLQQAQQHASMQAELERQRIEQQSRMESQRIEVTKAYHDAQIGMQKQRLDEVKRMHDEQVTNTAKYYAAQQAIEQEVQQGMAANPKADPNQLRIQASFRHLADLKMPGTGYASLINAARKMATGPARSEEITGLPGHRIVTLPDGTSQVVTVTEKPTLEEQRQSAYFKNKEEMLTDIIKDARKTRREATNKKIIEQADKDIQEAQMELDRMYYPTTRVPGASSGLNVVGGYDRSGKLTYTKPSAAVPGAPAPVPTAGTNAPVVPTAPRVRPQAAIPSWMEDLSAAIEDTDPVSAMKRLGTEVTGSLSEPLLAAGELAAKSPLTKGALELDSALASVVDLIGNTKLRNVVQSWKDDLSEYLGDEEPSNDEESQY